MVSAENSRREKELYLDFQPSYLIGWIYFISNLFYLHHIAVNFLHGSYAFLGLKY